MKEIDWSKLSFGYMKTDSMYVATIATENGVNWNFVRKKHLNIHMAATCLHYGTGKFRG